MSDLAAERVRVLAITNLYPPGFQGGYELGCSQVVAALRRAGHEVRVLTSTGPGGPDTARVLNVHRVFDPAVVSRLSPADRRALEIKARLFDPPNVTALEHELTTFEPDVAYLWNLVGIGGLGLAGVLCARRVPWVWHLMDAVPAALCGWNGELIGELSGAYQDTMSGSYLACSSHVLGEIQAAGIDLGERAELLPNWVSGELPARRTSFFDGAGVLGIVCAVGVLIEHKGIDLLIDAASRLRASHPGRFRLDLFGAETDDRFRRQAAERGLSEVVRFHGLMEQAELTARLGRYDVFAFPTAWREPFAFAPLEAAAAGCVPLLTNTSGNAEWMVGGVHCLKAGRTAKAFAACLAAILDGRIALEPIGRRAQRIVRDTFKLSLLLPRIEVALERAAAARPAGNDRLLALAAATAEHLLAQPSMG